VNDVIEIGVAQGPEIVYNNGVASKKPHQKFICKISSSSASNKVKGG
jgi:hypothetical protein